MKHHVLRAAPILVMGTLMGCGDRLSNLDFDLRNTVGGGLDTSSAARAAVASRPKPDSNGLISFPNYQVAVARRGDRIGDVADRIGANAAELARYNGIAADAPLRAGEVIALPRRVTGAATSTTSGTILTPTIVDVSELGSSATADPQPVRHQVASGETAFTIARLYGVSVGDLASWNGLGDDLALRNGQYLLIPTKTGVTTSTISAPGQGSATPTPPSSTRPQPRGDIKPGAATAAAATNAAKPIASLGNTTSSSASTAQMTRPVSGSIIRGYKKGSNEGIDISAPAGTTVVAAEKGVVAAVTKDTNGVPILVVKHAGNLLTVYTNVDGLLVKKGDSVSRGQKIAKVRAGNPSFLHFEVRKGLNSVDPDDYI